MCEVGVIRTRKCKVESCRSCPEAKEALLKIPPGRTSAWAFEYLVAGQTAVQQGLASLQQQQRRMGCRQSDLDCGID